MQVMGHAACPILKGALEGPVKESSKNGCFVEARRPNTERPDRKEDPFPDMA